MDGLQKEARCSCGELRIEVNAAPIMNSVCHCNDCQRRTGSAFGMSMYFEKTQVKFRSGEPQVYQFYHQEQSHEQRRYFCQSCGTTLYWTVSTLPDLIGVAGGCFDSHDEFEPTHSLNDSNKRPWVTLPTFWEKQGE